MKKPFKPKLLPLELENEIKLKTTDRCVLQVIFGSFQS